MGAGAPSAALSSREARNEAHKERGTRGRAGRDEGAREQQPPPNKPTRNTTKERAGAACIAGATRKRDGTRSPQAHKERGTPPYCKGAGSPSPHHKFAPKNQQKVAWGALKKFSEKFFGGMFRGQRKTPRVISTEGGL